MKGFADRLLFDHCLGSAHQRGMNPEGVGSLPNSRSKPCNYYLPNGAKSQGAI